MHISTLISQLIISLFLSTLTTASPLQPIAIKSENGVLPLNATHACWPPALNITQGPTQQHVWWYYQLIRRTTKQMAKMVVKSGECDEVGKCYYGAKSIYCNTTPQPQTMKYWDISDHISYLIDNCKWKKPGQPKSDEVVAFMEYFNEVDVTTNGNFTLINGLDGTKKGNLTLSWAKCLGQRDMRIRMRDCWTVDSCTYILG